VMLNAQELTVPDLSEGHSGPVVISMLQHKATETAVTALGDVLRTHPGTSEVLIRLNGSRTVEVMKLGVDLRVNPTPGLFGDLKVLLGPACLDA
jgi:DNA polymerase-3 subunit alpha